MARYWVQIDEAVEGPFEDRALLFVPGFKPETLVSPDREGAEETWVRASDVEELKFVCAPAQRPEPVPPPAPRIPVAPAPVLPPEPPPQEKFKETADFGEVPPSPDKDILEIIEQFPEVVVKKEAPAPKPEIPVETKAPPAPIQFPDEEFVLSVPTPSKKIFVILLAGALIAGGLAWFLVLGPGKGLLRRILKKTPPTPPAVPAEVKKEAPPSPKPAAKPQVKKAPAPPKPKPKAPAPQAAPRKQPVRRPAPAQEETLPDLKHQKFILPGVPAPDYRRKN